MTSDMVNPVLTATERLDRSRVLLREAMEGKSKRKALSSDKTSSPGWLSDFQSIPLVTVLVEAITSWWMQHPLHVAGQLAVDTARAVVQPLARRNPLGLVLGAVALGIFVAWVRPWRWILRPAMLVGLLPQLLSKSLAHLPLDAWISALSSLGSSPSTVNKKNTSGV